MEIHNIKSGAYCRLCAHYDQVNTLIDLNVDKEKYEEITSALSLLNATYIDLSKNNGLHLTICADCYYFLGKTHEFLCKVKNAQHTLTSLSLCKEVILPNDKIFTKVESADEFCYAPIEISLTSIKTETDDCHFPEIKVEFVDEANDRNTNLNKNICEIFNQNTNVSKNTDKPSNENINNFDTNDSDGSDNFEDIQDFEFDITNITKTFICKICDEKFDSRSKQYWHKVKAHNFNNSKMGKNGTPLTAEDLTCEYCKRVFNRMSYLYNHILSKHKKPEIYICEYCGIECHGRVKFQDHMKKHSGITHICRICNKMFKHRIELVSHVRRHMNVRQFECDHCGRRCVTKRDMKNHLKVHSDLKRFRCNLCNKAFKHKAYWKRHMTMHAGESVTRRMPFECNSCGRKFSCWGNCDKHMKRKHNTTLKKGNKDIAKTTEEETSNIDLEEWKKDVLVDLRRGQRLDTVRRGL